MQRIFVSLVLVIILFVHTSFISSAAPKKSTGAMTSSAQLLKARNSVRTYFGNLKGVSKVSYTLYYNGNGIGQGVYGSFVPGKKTSWSKDLYLGTCSGKVCTMHRNVKNIQLEVVSKYKNGTSSTRVLKIK
jgi:hypothetical protein